MITAIATALSQQFSWLILPSQVTGTQVPTLFKWSLPDTCDTGASVASYGGSNSEETFGDPFHIERPRFQVLVRHTDVDTANQWADNIWHFLGAVKDTTWSGVHFLRIVTIGNPNLLGKDTRNRWQASVNFEVWKERES